jgi:hypothetical protein
MWAIAIHWAVCRSPRRSGRPTAILKLTRHPYQDIRSALGSAAIPRGQEPALACNQRAGMAGAIGSGFENELATCYCRMMPGTGGTRIDEHGEEYVAGQ